jgi:predicted nuclease of predicted toxin-antitoxin system
MRFLANENFSLPSTNLLRAKGFDVLFIGESFPSITDEAVIEIAIAQNRTILTHDRDYGELVFRFGYKPPKGVVYFRLLHYLPEEPGEILIELMKNPDFKIENRFTVIDSLTIVRQRSI